MRKPRPRNSTRDRDVAELSTLRGLARDLEAHLAKLRCGDLPQTQLQPRRGLESAWRSLSERQARARQAAERKNRELNERVQSNADWIQRLWELLCEKRRAAETTGLVRMAGLHLKAQDDHVIRHLKTQAKQAAPQLPDIFALHGVEVLNESWGGDVQNEQWSTTQAGDLESTMVCTRRIPFDMHSTSASLWSALTRPERSFAAKPDSAVELRVLERTPSECTMKFQNGQPGDDNESTPVSCHAVVQRAAKANVQSSGQSADVFVWQSLFTLANGSANHTETMWATVVRCPLRSLESIVAVVCQIHIGLEPGPDAADLQASTMAIMEGCIDSILSSAENMLLDESLHSATHVSRVNTTPTQSVAL